MPARLIATRPHVSGRVVLTRFRNGFLILSLAVAYGTIGYGVVEGWSLVDSLYMTVITLTTVGFAEVRPLSEVGRIFTLTLLIFGLVGFVATVTALADVMVSGELGESARRRRMVRELEKLKDHFIICAFGRVGRAAAEELKEHGESYVIIDHDPGLESLMEEHGAPYIVGDPSQEATLEQAGIHRAKGLVCAVDSDASNVYITLTARAMNPQLHIVSRASFVETVDKLRRAGANRVISPYELSGRRMAFQALRPSVVEFIDMVTVAPDLRLEEILVGENSHLDGRTVGQACSTHPGVSILALKQGEELVPSPRQDAVLRSGDLVVALGPVTSLSDMAD